DKLYATGIPIQDLSGMVSSRVLADRVLLIMDACHSGAATIDSTSSRTGNVDAGELAGAVAQAIVCSCEPDQISWESKEYPNGVFTHYLIEGLSKKGKLNDAFQYLKAGVEDEVQKDRSAKQTPVLKSSWKADALQFVSK